MVVAGIGWEEGLIHDTLGGALGHDLNVCLPLRNARSPVNLFPPGPVRAYAQVQRIAHRMVSQWGFTANRSADPDFMVGWEAPDAGPFSTRTMSPDTESLIDQRTKDIVDGAYALCKATLIHHRPLLDALADELVHKETVTHAELLELLEAVERTGPGRLHTLANGMSEPPHTTHG